MTQLAPRHFQLNSVLVRFKPKKRAKLDLKFFMFTWDEKYKITGVFPAKTALELITAGNNFLQLPLD